jgi:hypothetical protein
MAPRRGQVMDELIKALGLLSNPVMAACAIYIARSIHELNLKIAVVVERVDTHERRLNKLEDHDR